MHGGSPETGGGTYATGPRAVNSPGPKEKKRFNKTQRAHRRTVVVPLQQADGSSPSFRGRWLTA